MSRMLAALASLVLTGLGLLVLLPDCASACSCAMPPGSQKERTERALSDSDAVLSGEVIDIEEGPRISMMGLRLPSSKATLQVSEVWKGPEQETLEVSTAADSMSCGYPFKEGQEYLVYAYGQEESLKAFLCTETKPLSKAGADLAVLGNGEKPTDGGDDLTDTSGIVPAGAVVWMAGLTIAAAWVVMVRLVRTG